MVLASCVLPSGIGSIYQGAAAWQLAYITTTPPALHSRQLVILKVRQFLAHLPKIHFYFLLIPEILLQSSWLLSSGTLTPECVDSGFGFKYPRRRACSFYKLLPLVSTPTKRPIVGFAYTRL